VKPRFLLVQPPIYDFTAYDYWLKPYGLLEVAGRLRGQADMVLFDFLDREHKEMASGKTLRRDVYGRGKFREEEAKKPSVFQDVQRRFRRFGLAREVFRCFLAKQGPFDVALIQTGMTYWYLGVDEVLEDLRQYAPATRCVLGGPYASLCPEHARSRTPDLVVEGSNLQPLWDFLGMSGNEAQPPLWEAYERLETGVLRLIRGCPFRCTYCASRRLSPEISVDSLEKNRSALDTMLRLGAKHVVFYDDALLYRFQEVLLPFLHGVGDRLRRCTIHMPNAVHARWMTPEVVRALVKGAMGRVYLGLESVSCSWMEASGNKVSRNQFLSAVDSLRSEKVPASSITAYILVGHPDDGGEGTEDAIDFVYKAGVRSMLAEFSPVPFTQDGEKGSAWCDLSEPLNHNKTAFAIRRLGKDRLHHLKNLCKSCNERLAGSAS